jgi:hypothetical protein
VVATTFARGLLVSKTGPPTGPADSLVVAKTGPAKGLGSFGFRFQKAWVYLFENE